MRISGTGPLSVILNQTDSLKKLKSTDQKVSNEAEAKTGQKGWCYKLTKLKFLQFQIQTILMLSKRY